MKKLKQSAALIETNHAHSKKMSHYSCVDLSQVTEAELKEAKDQLLASAKVYKARRALIESGQLLKTILDEQRAKENANREFTLCQRCVMASPQEQVPEPDTE
jgi:hypothetical protein